jgi:hypothetical protein
MWRKKHHRHDAQMQTEFVCLIMDAKFSVTKSMTIFTGYVITVHLTIQYSYCNSVKKVKKFIRLVEGMRI